MQIAITESMCALYDRFSVYNSPYRAHETGCAIDLYPDATPGRRTRVAPCPVSGTVLETTTVTAPSKSYAVDCDHLLLIECRAPESVEGLIARVLHVDPESTIEAEDTVEIGDSLGTLIRSGFFAPWVDNHLHVDFRQPEQHLHRASGSHRITVDLPLRGLPWDGSGHVVEIGDTFVVLDEPTHPNPGNEWAGIAADCGGILDGGLPHYDGGGLFRPTESDPTVGDNVTDDRHRDGVRLNGDRLGSTTDRTITWDDVVVTANGEAVTGLSLFLGRDEHVGAKIICPEHGYEIGDRIDVGVRSSQL